MIRAGRVLSFALAGSLASATAGLTVGTSDRLKNVNRALEARGYRGPLTSKEHAVAKFFPNGPVFSVTLWMTSPSGTRLRDARQIKFTQSYCKVPGFLTADFWPLAKTERDAFFREVIGQTPPAELDADMPTLSYDQPKDFKVPQFRKVRLTRRPMKCDIHGGDAYELDFFP